MKIDLIHWPTYFDNNGCLLDEYKLRKTAFFNGLSENVRGSAWPFLLNLWERDSTSLNRHHTSDRLRQKYETIRNGWINAVPELFDPEMKQSIKIIDKDVRRTDREHPFYSDDKSEGLRILRRILISLSVYDAELAYIQGMNEVISPMLLTLQEEHLTFWCFIKLLPMLRDRLLTLDLSPQLSSTADLIQYFDEELYQHIERLTGGHWLFCFRWFLLLFKNEFKMNDILRLWDVLFSQYNTTHFDIFVAASILLMHREQVIACSASDQLLHFAQSVSAKLAVESVISYACDLSVRIASTEGLSENLKALVKQADKVPPPLVGFVRRRQCFKNIYTGRANMNDAFIKTLLEGHPGNITQSTPLFFNCTESPVPVPSSNFLSGIQGATPLTLAVKPGLAPPPTADQIVTSVGVSSTKSRQRRPDALYKDSVSANATNKDSRFQKTMDSSHYDQGYSVSSAYNEQSPNGNNFATYYADANGVKGQHVQSTPEYHYQSNLYHHQEHSYNGTQQNNYQYSQQYDSNGNQIYHNQHYNDYELSGNQVLSYDHQNIPGNQIAYTDPTQFHQHPQGYIADTALSAPTQSHQHPQGYIANTNQSITASQVGDPTHVLEAPPVADSPECALNVINDDFWDMKVSVHTNDALS